MIAACAEGTRQKHEKTERMTERSKVELFFKFISPNPKQMTLRLVLQSIAKSSSLKIPIPISRQQSKKERSKKEKGNNHFEKKGKKRLILHLTHRDLLLSQSTKLAGTLRCAVRSWTTEFRVDGTWNVPTTLGFVGCDPIDRSQLPLVYGRSAVRKCKHYSRPDFIIFRISGRKS